MKSEASTSNFDQLSQTSQQLIETQIDNHPEYMIGIEDTSKGAMITYAPMTRQEKPAVSIEITQTGIIVTKHSDGESKICGVGDSPTVHNISLGIETASAILNSEL